MVFLNTDTEVIGPGCAGETEGRCAGATLSYRDDKEPSMTVLAFDLDHPELIAQELAEAGGALGRAHAQCCRTPL